MERKKIGNSLVFNIGTPKNRSTWSG
jgi:hypothetical protein